jgi:hypothetical protein
VLETENAPDIEPSGRVFDGDARSCDGSAEESTSSQLSKMPGVPEGGA